MQTTQDYYRENPHFRNIRGLQKKAQTLLLFKHICIIIYLLQHNPLCVTISPYLELIVLLHLLTILHCELSLTTLYRMLSDRDAI